MNNARLHESPRLQRVARVLSDHKPHSTRDIIPRATPKVEGMSFRDNWRFEITDPNLIPREYLSVDTVKIGGVVKVMKDGASIPGVRVFCEKIAVSRTA
jgi:hypothetical protein